MEKQTKSIKRSLSQVMAHHLPGDIRSIDGKFYRVTEIESKLISDMNKDWDSNKINYLNNFIKESIFYNWIADAKKIFMGKAITIEDIFDESMIIKGQGSIDLNNISSIADAAKCIDFDKIKLQEINTIQEANHKAKEILQYYCKNCHLINRNGKICSCGSHSLSQIDPVLASSAFPNIIFIPNECRVNDGKCQRSLKLLKNNSEKITTWKLFCGLHTENLNPPNISPFQLYGASSKRLFNIQSFECVYIEPDQELIDYLNKVLVNKVDQGIELEVLEKETIIQIFEKDCCDFLAEYQHFPWFQRYLKDKFISPSLLKYLIQKIIQNANNENSRYKVLNSTNLISPNWQPCIGIKELKLITDLKVLKTCLGFSRVYLNYKDSLYKEKIKNNPPFKKEFIKFFPFSQPNGRELKAYTIQEQNEGILFNIDKNFVVSFLLKIDILKEKTNKEIEKLLNKSLIDIPENIGQNDFEILLNTNLELKYSYYYLHSLAHFCMKSISSQFSGISISSLKEMIFFKNLSFLIYKRGITKNLGYLESFFNNTILMTEFNNFISNLVNMECPNILDKTEQNQEHACIECLYTTVHSCEHFNHFLSLELLQQAAKLK